MNQRYIVGALYLYCMELNVVISNISKKVYSYTHENIKSLWNSLTNAFLQQVHEALDQQLAAARAENEKIRQLMGEMGVSPRPTVAQWLQQKKQQKKRDMQEALISWDRCACFAV